MQVRKTRTLFGTICLSMNVHSLLFNTIKVHYCNLKESVINRGEGVQEAHLESHGAGVAARRSVVSGHTNYSQVPF